MSLMTRDTSDERHWQSKATLLDWAFTSILRLTRLLAGRVKSSHTVKNEKCDTEGESARERPTTG